MWGTTWVAEAQVMDSNRPKKEETAFQRMALLLFNLLMPGLGLLLLCHAKAW